MNSESYPCLYLVDEQRPPSNQSHQPSSPQEDWKTRKLECAGQEDWNAEGKLGWMQVLCVPAFHNPAQPLVAQPSASSLPHLPLWPSSLQLLCEPCQSTRKAGGLEDGKLKAGGLGCRLESSKGWKAGGRKGLAGWKAPWRAPRLEGWRGSGSWKLGRRPEGLRNGWRAAGLEGKTCGLLRWRLARLEGWD